jgi:hypothetical protein
MDEPKAINSDSKIVYDYHSVLLEIQIIRSSLSEKDDKQVFIK